MAYVEYEADGKTIKARVQQKTDTLANWMANDNIVLAGEQAFVVNDDGTPLNFKIGDGTKPFRDLPNWIDFSNAQRVSSVAPGVLPAGPAEETKYMEVTAIGTYTYGGNTLAEITEDGYKATFWWTGTEWISNGVVRVRGEEGLSKLDLFNESKAGGYSENQVVRDSEFNEFISLIDDNESLLNSEDWMPKYNISPFGKNIFDYQNVVTNKIINTTTGAEETLSGFSISPKMNTGGVSIAISGLGSIHHGLGWAFIDESGTVLRRGVSGLDVTSFTANGVGLTGDVYFHFTVKTNKSGDNTNLQNIQVEIGSSSTSFEPFKASIDKIIGKEINVHNVNTNPLNSKSPVNIDYLNSVAVTDDNIELEPSKNRFNYVDVEDGYIDGSTGAYVVNSLYKRTKPIPIDEKGLLTISGLGNIHHGLGWRFNKADGSVASFGSSSLDVTSFTVNSSSLTDVVSFQFTIKTGKTGDNTVVSNVQVEYGGVPTSFEPYSPVIKSIKGYELASSSANVYAIKTFGKKVLFLGDSITTEDGGVSSWATFARPLLGVTDYKNYARSGASFTDWAYTENIRQQLSAQIEQAITDGYVPDIIVIAIGTNDYLRLSLLGDYDTAIGKATLADLDRTKVIEAARWAFWKCKTQWANAVCFYVNPLQRANTPNSTESNDNGDWLRDPIERMARRYNFTVIDQYGRSGVVKDFEVNGGAGRYLTDGLHPNTNGKNLQAKFLANEIINNYY